jgi:hypothetical protein
MDSVLLSLILVANAQEMDAFVRAKQLTLKFLLELNLAIAFKCLGAEKSDLAAVLQVICTWK